MEINQLLELDRLARDDGRKYEKKREIYEDIFKDTGAQLSLSN